MSFPPLSTKWRIGCSLGAFSSAAFSRAGKVLAQKWAGPLPGGLPGPENIEDARATVAGILQKALTYLALLATVIIVIAGFRLIISMGDEEGKENAKKTILYVAAGLLIIILAKALVAFLVSLGNPQ